MHCQRYALKQIFNYYYYSTHLNQVFHKSKDDQIYLAQNKLIYGGKSTHDPMTTQICNIIAKTSKKPQNTNMKIKYRILSNVNNFFNKNHNFCRNLKNEIH